jgi:hypothetical protein
MDGGCICVGGVTYYQPFFGKGSWLIKFDNMGDTLWTKRFKPTQDLWYYLNFASQTSDGGYICSGSLAEQAGDYDITGWLFKTDTFGNTIWTKTFEPPLNYSYEFNSAQPANDGGYIISARLWEWINNGYGERGLWLVKTNNTGDTLWTKLFFTDEGGGSVGQTSDGGYILTGKRNNNILLIKTDNLGNEIWTKSYDEGGGISVQQTSDGGYFITTGSESILIKTDSSGDTLWTKSSGGHTGMQTSDDGYILIGGNIDVILTKLAPDLTDINQEKQTGLASDYVLKQNYPNPFNPATTITFTLPRSDEVSLKVYNILGEEVAILVSEKLPAGLHHYNWDATNLTSGIYIYRLEAGEFVSSSKMVLLR